MLVLAPCKTVVGRPNGPAAGSSTGAAIVRITAWLVFFRCTVSWYRPVPSSAGTTWSVVGSPGGPDAAPMAGDCNDKHSSFKCRQTQTGMIGLLDLVGSSSHPARSLAARRAREPSVRRSVLSPSPPSAPPPSDAGRAPSDCSSSHSSEPEHGSDGHRAATYSGNASDLCDGSDSLPDPVKLMGVRRPGRQRRRTDGRSRAESDLIRKGILKSLILAALRRSLGARTRADASSGGGMMAKVVGSGEGASRCLFCVVGPHAVDLASLWVSPDGMPLCSCWGHTQNVALLMLTGEPSSCWHAAALQSAMDDMSEDRDELVKLLKVADNAKPHAVDVLTNRGMAAAAFDGVIYSPVVATRRRDVKCVAVGCRSSQRRCHHARLVKGLGRFAVTDDADNDVSDVTTDDEPPRDDKADEDGDVDEDELIAIAKHRQKRNLLSCVKEDEQATMWSRTAEWAAEGFSNMPMATPLASGGHSTEAPAPTTTVLQRLTELGVAFDPSVPVYKKTCSQCGATKTDDIVLQK